MAVKRQKYQLNSKIFLYYVGEITNKLMNTSTWKGKKSAMLIKYVNANFSLKKKWGFCIGETLPLYIKKYSPRVVLRTVKVAGNTYRIPYELTQQKQSNLFLKDLQNLTRSPSKKESYRQALIKEISALWNNRSVLLHKKEEIHKKAESGSAYLQYRW